MQVRRRDAADAFAVVAVEPFAVQLLQLALPEGMDDATRVSRYAQRRRRTPGRAALWVAAALAALWVGWPAAARAATYYVRAGGDDANDGLTPATALASVRPAARRLREPGDRLIVGPGTYREGNIGPFGNGTPEAPIVLSGDATGAATGDPPGPVLILPPNTPAATSGFYVRGRNDIVIEGFEVAGASDAGIEVRARRARTAWPVGSHSTRITVRNNRVRGSRKGIQITAVGDVEVSGNHISGPREDPSEPVGDGLVLFGEMRPTVSGNVIEDCFIGMTGERLSGAVISGNEIRTGARNLQFRGNERLTLVGNRFLGPIAAGEVFAAELSVLDNVIEARIALGATGELEIRRNTIRGRVGIRRSPARAHIADNAVAEIFIGGGGDVVLERNEGRALKTKGVETIAAIGNRFGELMKVRVAASAEVDDNEAGAVTVRATAATVRGNAVARHARIVADTASVAGNTVGSLAVQAPELGDAPREQETALEIRDNVVAGALFGVGADTVRIEANAVAGFVKAIARRAIDVVGNEARGIACTASAPGSHVTLRDNRSRQSAGPGLAVVGAEMATIERNVASDNADSGLVVRRTARVVATGNALSSNGRGGVSVRVPPAGDCNEDVDVTIDDLLTVVCIALQRRPLHDCDAADANRDRAVTVDEVVLSVGAALGRPDPVTSTVELRDNRVENNRRFGINVFARATVVAAGNRVLRNGGIPLAVHGLGPLGDALLTGNVLGMGSAEGLFVEAVDTARVRDNVVFSNRDAGILLRATPGAAIANNLVYGNGGPGIAVGLGDPRPTSDALLTNNTIVANGDWGIAVGSGAVPSTGTAIRDNILHQNVAGGVTAAPGALPGLTVAFNVNTGGYGPGVSPGPTDLAVDPQLVAPAGADGVLGNEGFADDDFHLQPGSPAVDAGSAPAAELGVTGSAVAGRTDDGIVDLGYHYGADDR